MRMIKVVVTKDGQFASLEGTKIIEIPEEVWNEASQDELRELAEEYYDDGVELSELIE